MDLSIIRDHLSDRELTEATLSYFIEHAVERFAQNHRDEYEEAAIRVFEHCLRTFYPQAIKFVYTYTESPIERIFLNSLILTFVYLDPLGLLVTAPHSDVLQSLAAYKEPRLQMLDIDRQVEGEVGSPYGYLRVIEGARDAGELTEETYQELHSDYVFAHRLGFFDSFHLTIQPGFPHLRVGNRSVRGDLFVCIPSYEPWKLVVECDGFTFHSNKDSFTSDRKRDRLFKAHSIEVMRFSGPEIHRDPVGVGKELFDYLQTVRRTFLEHRLTKPVRTHERP